MAWYELIWNSLRNRLRVKIGMLGTLLEQRTSTEEMKIVEEVEASKGSFKTKCHTAIFDIACAFYSIAENNILSWTIIRLISFLCAVNKDFSLYYFFVYFILLASALLSLNCREHKCRLQDSEFNFNVG